MLHEGDSQLNLRWEARGGPFDLLVPAGVFVPSHTSQAIAEVLEIDSGATVIDVGCGSGVLSFVAARLGAGRVFGTDISKEAIAAASQNALRLGLDHITSFSTGPLFEPLEHVEADVIIGDVSGVPDALADLTGWLPGGGPSGAEVPLAMLAEVHEWLCPGGVLYLPTGTIQDGSKLLAAASRIFGRERLELVFERRFPLPGRVARSETVTRLIADGVMTPITQGTRLLWELKLWRCRRSS